MPGPNPNDTTHYLGYDGKNGPSSPPATAGVVGGRGYAQLNPDGEAINHSRYKPADAWGPASQSQQEVQALQLRLTAAGYAPKGGFRAGVWNSDAASAYANALGDANYAGRDVNGLIDSAIAGGQGSAGGAGGGGGSVGPSKSAVTKPNLVTGGHTIELTAPQDIEKSASDTFQKILGRNIHADETLTLVQQLQNIDRLNQATKYGQEDTVKGANFMQDMATANQRQAESNASADQTLALHQQAQGAGANTILPGADTSGMQVGGFQTQLPNAETVAPANPAAYAEWIIKTRMPNEYLGSQMADRARQMGDFLTKPTAPQGGPLTRTRV